MKALRLVLFLLVACVCLSSSIAAATPEAETVASDTPRTTPDGHRFVVPAGWSIRTRGPQAILTAPEGDSRIVLIDARAENADAAVATAWAAYDAAAKRPLKLASDRPPRDGWTEIRSYQYETSASDRRTVSAQARRRGDRWVVAILDMSDAVVEKRDAEIERIYSRLLPQGYTRETFAGKTAHALDAPRVETLKRFVEDARRAFDVPGVAVGIAQRDKIVFAGGFGVRELGKPEAIDADTLFLIASNTKPLTTLMLAKLVEQGRFGWDTPVTSVLPTFKLGDAEATRQIRMKHLVCACTGLPRQDMEWLFEGENATPESMMATLATMRPTSAFGALYQYSNTIAAAAGFVGAHALYPDRELGAAYDAAMQSLVFDPLGMTSTTFDFARAQRSNHASPHGQDVDGRTVRASMDLNYSGIASRPDGGAWSNVKDLLRYVEMELDRGRLPGGARYIDEAPLLARRVEQVSRGDDTGYGMGLKIDRSLGTPLLNHGGSMIGYISDVLWLPEHDVGAVILTNADGGGVYVRSLFRRRLLEVLFDGEPKAVPSIAVQSRRMKDEFAAERKRLTVPADPNLAAALAERYRSAELGSIVVSRKDGATLFDFGGWKSEVASRRDDGGTVSFVTVSPGEGGFEFIAAGTDGRRSLVLRDAQHEYVFAEDGSPALPAR